MPLSLGRLIRRARFEKDEMTQQQLADAITVELGRPVSRQTVGRWEHDPDAAPSVHELRAIIAATGDHRLLEFFDETAA